MTAQASTLVVAGFILLPLAIAALFVFACEWAARRVGQTAEQRRGFVMRAAAGVSAWLLLTAVIANTGLLRRFDILPPPFAIMVLALFAIAIWLSFSGVGLRLMRGLPLWALIGFQVFRLPLELLMHQAYVEGVMPVQMSYSGYNLDIISGITAGALGLWLFFGRAPGWVVVLWNLLGSALLVTIITIAILSTPVFRYFGDDRVNVFVTYFPFVWLPAVLVTAALLGHLLLWRRLAVDGV